MSPRHEPVAIVGIGCRFPGGANGPAELWERLCAGFDGIVEVPPHRFDLAAVYDPRPAMPGKIQSRHGGFLGPVDAFDAAFFEISPREAVRIDPQQRLLLEVGWEALEDAGLPPERLPRSRTGVFLGMMSNDFEDLLQRDPETLDLYGLNGAGRYGACGRLSFCLGLEGPSLAVDTACSSSLVSVHLACQSLRCGESEVALAGGSHLILQPHTSIALSQGKILSAEGRCRFGDARADGFVRGEGVALVVLKTLRQALSDGDRIYAVIRGSAVNSDGRSNGVMVTPSQVTQEEMLREAYRNAGVAPSRVRYVEAHGIGTTAGDRVELAALGAVLCGERPAGRPCRVGSIKSNIGHTEGASGVAGLIKLALCLHYRRIPRSLHCEELSPALPWNRLPLCPQRETAPWPEEDPYPAVGGVNSFGLAGTNAHMVVEEPPRPEPGASAAPKGAFLVPLSARQPEALRSLAQAWIELLARSTPPDLADLAYTAGARRHHFEHRLALVARSCEELASGLRTFLAAQAPALPAPGCGDGAAERLGALGRLYLAGEPMDWRGLYPEGGRVVRLPSYPWQRERFWPRQPPESGAGRKGSHPLLGPHVRLAAPAGLHVWEGELRADAPAYLGDHRVQGAAVFPAAAYLEMALAAASAALGGTAYTIVEARFESALVLSENRGNRVQAVLVEEPGGASFEVFGREEGADGWTLQATAHLRAEGGEAAPGPLPPEDLCRRCREEMDGAGFYRAMAARGLDYGPAFRALERLWRGEGEAVARLAPRTRGDEGHAVHPALLDACLQTLVVALPADLRQASADTYLPIGLSELRVWRRPEQGPAAWTHARLAPSEPAGGVLSGDLELLDGEGRVLLAARGLTLRRLEGGFRQGAVEESAGDLRATFASATPEEKRSLLAARLRRETAAVLRLPPERLDESRALIQLGLDSLMALELKVRLDTGLGVSVPVARLLRGLSFRQLLAESLEELGEPPSLAMPLGAGDQTWEEIEL